MLKSDLIKLLSVFSREERTQMRAFINSPYVNPQWPTPQVERLVEAIFTGLESENKADLQKDRLYQKVFLDDKQVFNKIEKLASQTLKLVRSFIQFETMKKFKTEPFDLYLLQQFFLEKKMPEEIEQTHARLLPWKSSRTQWGYWDYCVNWLTEEVYMCFQNEYFQKKNSRYLLSPIMAIEDLYLNERTYYTSFWLNNKQMDASFTEDETSELIKALHFSEDAKYIKTLTGQLFQQVFILITAEESDIQMISSFINSLKSEGLMLNKVYLNQLEVIAINYCIKHNGKDRRFLPLLYSLLKQRVESKRTFYEGRIAASEFQNIVKTGLVCRDFEWVKTFMEENKDKITGSPNPEELYRYNLANYLFYTKQYDQALDILLRVGYDELQYKISAKVLEIKILYETESEVLPAKIDAAKIFFYREKSLSPQRKEQYCGFADFMRRLIRPQTAVNEDRIKKLKEELQAPPSIAERYWVEEKLDELLKKV